MSLTYNWRRNCDSRSTNSCRAICSLRNRPSASRRALRATWACHTLMVVAANRIAMMVPSEVNSILCRRANFVSK
jgi:hypothetical protein